MNQSNNKLPALAALNQITLTAGIGLDDIVNVFIAKFESDLVTQRTSNQRTLASINSVITSTMAEALTLAQNAIDATGITTTTSNEWFTTKQTVGKVSLDWDKGFATFSIQIRHDANTGAGEHRDYTSGSINSAIAIDADFLAQYKALLAQKTEVTNVLSQINLELRDVSRKERAVRGQIAQRKLDEAGLSDLLQDQTLLSLIDTSSIGQSDL